MIACTSFVSTARSTPLTISVPSSRATCRFFSSSSAMVLFPSSEPRAADFVHREAAQRAGFIPLLVTRILAGPARETTAVRALVAMARERCGGGRRGHAEERERSGPGAERDPRRSPCGRLPRLGVEAAVRAGIARQRLEEVVGRVDRLRLLRVLALPAHAEQHAIGEPRRE